MISWLSANLINIVLILAVVLLVTLVIRGLVRDRQSGKAPCGGSCAGCGCAHCSAAGGCRSS